MQLTHQTHLLRARFIFLHKFSHSQLMARKNKLSAGNLMRPPTHTFHTTTLERGQLLVRGFQRVMVVNKMASVPLSLDSEGPNLLDLPVELLETLVLCPDLAIRDICTLSRVCWTLNHVVSRIWAKIAKSR